MISPTPKVPFCSCASATVALPHSASATHQAARAVMRRPYPGTTRPATSLKPPVISMTSEKDPKSPAGSADDRPVDLLMTLETRAEVRSPARRPPGTYQPPMVARPDAWTHGFDDHAHALVVQ